MFLWDIYCKHCLWSIFGPCLCTKSCKPPFMRICGEFENRHNLRALSGRFLRQKSCYPESFRFLWLWSWAGWYRYRSCILWISSFLCSIFMARQQQQQQNINQRTINTKPTSHTGLISEHFPQSLMTNPWTSPATVRRRRTQESHCTMVEVLAAGWGGGGRRWDSQGGDQDFMVEAWAVVSKCFWPTNKNIRKQKCFSVFAGNSSGGRNLPHAK